MMTQGFTTVKMTSDQAREYLAAWANNGFNASKLSDVYGGSTSRWRERIRQAKKMCPDSGIIPTDVPNGLAFTKTTVQYDASGNVIQEWRRLAKDQVNPEELAAKVVKICGGKIPKLPNIKVPKDNDLCLFIPFYDVHIGKYAWAKESGEDYDLNIVEKILVNTTSLMCQRAGMVKKTKIIIGGDFFHADNKTMQTERGGNVLDIDTRIEKVRDVAVEALHKCIVYCLKYCEEVEMVFIPGNHDYESMFWLSRIFEAAYSKSKNVVINRSPKTRRYIQWGVNLIGVDHGENKITDYVSLMPCEVPELWAQTTERVWFLGHIHQEKVFQKHGVTVIHLESVSSADGWHFQHGYVGNPRRTTGFLYDAKYGLRSRLYVKVDECFK